MSIDDENPLGGGTPAGWQGELASALRTRRLVHQEDEAGSVIVTRGAGGIGGGGGRIHVRQAWVAPPAPAPAPAPVRAPSPPRFEPTAPSSSEDGSADGGGGSEDGEESIVVSVEARDGDGGAGDGGESGRGSSTAALQKGAVVVEISSEPVGEASIGPTETDAKSVPAEHIATSSKGVSRGGAQVAAATANGVPIPTKEEKANKAAQCTAATTVAPNLPIPDPASFPRTDSGLAAFLAAVDGDRPLAEFGLDTLAEAARVRAEAESIASSLLTVSTYHASSFVVDAGKSREVPIAVPVSGSEVRIERVAVAEGTDVSFGIELRRGVPGPGGRLRTRRLRQSSRIAAFGASSAAAKGRKKGDPGAEFTVPSAPASVVLTFDNTASWITPVNVSYHVTVTEPRPAIPHADPSLFARSDRAERAAKVVRGEIGSAEEEARRRVEELTAVEGEVREAVRQIEDADRELDELRVRVGSAEEDVVRAGSIAEERAEDVGTEKYRVEDAGRAMEALVVEITDIDMQIERLLKKRDEREARRRAMAEEKESREKQLEGARMGYLEALDEIARREEEVKERQREVKVTVEAQERDEERVTQIAERHEAARKAEEEASERVNFFKRQHENLQLRLDKVAEV